MEHEQNPEAHNPVITIQNFITSLWMHPLLTTSTQQHRLALDSKVSTALPEGMTDQIAIVPTDGSSVWITTGTSDHDVFALLPDQKHQFDFYGKFSSPLQLAGISVNAAVSVDGLPWSNLAERMVNLFVTPDVYAAGAMELIYLAREKVVGYLQQLKETELMRIWIEAADYFKKKYMGWGREFDIGDIERFGQDQVVKDKPQRLQSALAIRALQERFPRRWLLGYERMRASMTLPWLSEFMTAFQQTNYHNDLDPRFAATGIEEKHRPYNPLRKRALYGAAGRAVHNSMRLNSFYNSGS